MGSFGFPRERKYKEERAKGKDSWEETIAQKSLCFPLGVPVMRRRGERGKGPCVNAARWSTPTGSFSEPWLFPITS